MSDFHLNMTVGRQQKQLNIVGAFYGKCDLSVMNKINAYQAK